MKKFFAKPSVLIALLCVLMISTFAVSFTYWKSTIAGNSNDRGLNISIGTGKAAETKVVLTSPDMGTKSLVPTGRVQDPLSETETISFDIDVTWVADTELNEQEIENFTGHTGLLTISVVDIVMNGTSVTDWIGLGNAPLFRVNFQAQYDINGEETITVPFVVSMREPATKEQYNQVAGSDITVTLGFLIESAYEQ